MSQSETAHLDQLFDEWEKQYKEQNATCPGTFVKDGIINQKAWEMAIAAKNKNIVYLLREANHESKSAEFQSDDLREWHQKRPWRILGSMAYGIRHSTATSVPPYDAAAKESVNHCSSIAVVNLKKISGGGSVKDTSLIQEAVDRDWNNFISKELSIIKPDIVVCGGTWDFIANIVIPQDRRSSMWATVSRDGRNETWIKYIHPSVPYLSHKILYDRLMALYQSILKESGLAA